MVAFWRLVAVVEGEARGRRVHEFGGIYVMPSAALIGVVRFLLDGVILGEVTDGDSDKIQVKVTIAAVPPNLMRTLQILHRRFRGW